MIVKVYDQKGKEVGEARLPKEIFKVKMNPDLVHQVALVQTANRRRKIAKTKGRAEVRGGGRKPWRQKGTGRARAGSIRSPIWRGGGVTFGPTTVKVFKKKIPKKMRRKALFMVLSAKAKENLLLVLDKLEIEKAKTKAMAEILNKLFLKKGSGLVVLLRKDKNIIKATRNIPKTATMQAKDLNVLDLLSYKYLVMPKEAIKIIKDTFLK
ncbi:50S ribosomal protein L4 [Patescibacteria group bacterium]|nr:50S ribosomal protein L4 [Patescibacteria group bacterium]